MLKCATNSLPQFGKSCESGPPPNLGATELAWQPVTRANWRAVCRLKVWPHQRHFVPSVSKTLALAYLASDGAQIEPFAITLAGKPIGFFSCTHYPNYPDLLIFGGFLIDAASQRKGWGRQFLGDFLKWVPTSYPQCRQVLLNLKPQNLRAGQLYLDAGFDHVKGSHPWWPHMETFRFRLVGTDAAAQG